MRVVLFISLGVPYIKTIFINGKEYINTDYKPELKINLGVPYIQSVKLKGREYINTSYRDDSTKKMK
jgi:hypothetical protein